MTREMPKIKRTRKLVITEKQAVGSCEEEDIIRQGNFDEGKSCNIDTHQAAADLVFFEVFVVLMYKLFIWSRVHHIHELLLLIGRC